MESFQAEYGKIEPPTATPADTPVDLTNETMREHREKVLQQMNREQLEVLLIYGDREHGANYGYLTGFEPRFEESVLVLHKDREAFLLLGNEMLKMVKYSRIPAKAIHTPHFSLPNQPMETQLCFTQLLKKAGLRKGMKAGIAGWKLFTGTLENNENMFDVPAFILNSVQEIVGTEGCVKNATGIFIHPGHGARIRVNANEAAHYEFGASLAGECIRRGMEQIDVGISEMDLAENLSAYGQPLTVQTICASGERFTNAVVAPRKKLTERGDKVSLTMGLRGGLTCRCGYLVAKESELPEGAAGYMEKAVKPYFTALAVWYSKVRLGTSAKEIYAAIQETIPRERFGWKLNPGHYTATEEWMSSPFYENSDIVLGSGMMLQMDIIIEVPGVGGANAEDGILLANGMLRDEIRQQYPLVWKRMQKRQRYMREVLGIPVGDEVLPMSGLCGYFRPYFLCKEKAMYIK